MSVQEFMWKIHVQPFKNRVRVQFCILFYCFFQRESTGKIFLKVVPTNLESPALSEVQSCNNITVYLAMSI